MIWQIDLSDLMGQHRTVETHEGSFRSGRITKVNWFELIIDNKTVMVPASIEMNNDATDFITFNAIKTISKPSTLDVL